MERKIAQNRRESTVFIIVYHELTLMVMLFMVILSMGQVLTFLDHSMTHSAQKVCLHPFGVPSSWSLNFKRQIVQDSSGLSLSEEDASALGSLDAGVEEAAAAWPEVVFLDAESSCSSSEDDRSRGFFFDLLRLIGESPSPSVSIGRRLRCARMTSSSSLETISTTLRFAGRRVLMIGLL